MTEPAGTVRILGLEDTEADRQDRVSWRRPEEWRIGRGEIPVEQLRQRVGDFLASMRDVLSDVPELLGDYELDQIQISAEVSAKGQVSLLGTGGELAGKSGLTFTFKRRPPESPSA